MNKPDPIPARLAALKTTPTPDLKKQWRDLFDSDARAALQHLDPLWDELFPAEQARIVTLLVERVDMRTDGLNVRLRVDGLSGLAREMLSGGIGEAA